MKGEGVFARLLAQRFTQTCGRLGLNKARQRLDDTQFRPPPADTRQMNLF
jgi:hypothetical protein